MNPAQKSVLVMLSSMKYPNTGLYFFGKRLGDALLRQRHEFDLTYYLPENAYDYFEDRVKIVQKSWWHKYFLLSASRYQLVHYADQFCRPKPKGIRGKKILTLHDLNFLHEHVDNHKKINKDLKKLGKYLQFFDQVVTISHFVQEELLVHFPHLAGRVQVIYNGADRLRVPTRHQPLYIPKRRFLFTIGMVSPKKNFHVLPALLEKNDFELVIAGIRSDYEERIWHEAHRFNCVDRVKVIGPVSEADKAWYYQQCEAFVFPSTAEGFGLPVIEAMHFGKPVFLSTRTSLPEIGGELAFYFSTFDPEAMQQVFRDGLEIFHREQPQEKIISHANQFSWDRAASQYLTLYAQCLESTH